MAYKDKNKAKEFNLSEILRKRKKNLLKFRTDTALCAKMELDDFEEDVKEFIKIMFERGEILKNGAFVINAFELRRLAGEKLCYVFACDEGLKRATIKVKELNKKVGKNPVHLRKAVLIIEEELKPRRVSKPSSPRGKK